MTEKPSVLPDARTSKRKSEIDPKSITGDMRGDLHSVIQKHARTFYCLTKSPNALVYLMPAAVLVPLRGWLKAHVAANGWVAVDQRVGRTMVVHLSAPAHGAGAIEGIPSDRDLLATSDLHLPDLGISLYFYNRIDSSTYRARSVSAPMRNCNFDAMTEPFYGFQHGNPVCAISADELVPSGRTDHVSADSDPIDIVYTWVDSDGRKWRQSFETHVGRPTASTHASDLRYLSRDELRYSLRSVCKHAPWVRRIFIVTDGQRPDWLIDDDRVTIVDHRDIFPDPSVLPVFNSHAIESCLHRIPGLAERFIYFNDDLFLGCPITPQDFFGKTGDVCVYFSGHLSFNPEWIADGPLPTDAAFRNTMRIVGDRFGFIPVAKVLHTPHAMKTSVLRLIERDNAKQIAETRSARIRSDTDLNITSNLAYYYYVGLGMARWPTESARMYRYIDTGRKAHLRHLVALVRQPAKFFCLNLTSHREVSLRRQAMLMKITLTLMFPRRAKHERGLIASLMRKLQIKFFG